ncbi:hypothetical protein like AT3G25270 [Hibiscus trionum]|uniref:RNase H type-1 domain-containing protein n=1 Tax=Hibiscus trionum TaxID=183268 RepID=A0A9W7LM88_HIBTR|nr:hypothetical protein like AT3G25270 [Hibiscus trionum]
MRLASWYKAVYPAVTASIESIMNNPACADQSPSLASVQVWSAPPLGFLKLNFDGAMAINGNAGGIGGIIRNHLGVVISSYSNRISAGPAIMAELLALKFGLNLVNSLDECKNFRIIAEGDCKLIFDWISNPSLCPHQFQNLIQEIVVLGVQKGCCFRLIPRHVNTEADSLAKRGIG